MAKRRRQKITVKQLTIIGLIIALPITIFGIIDFWNLLPHPNLSIASLHWEVYPTYNQDNTTIIKLNTTFPAQITNRGNVPLHIVACDVFLTREGKPSNLSDERLNEIAYLKPQDSLSYNFTKTFDVSMPTNAVTIGDMTNYILLVMYYTDNPQSTQSVWLDPSKILTP